MDIITQDIIMDTDMSGEAAAALDHITGLTAVKTKAENAKQYQKSDKLSVKYWRRYSWHDVTLRNQEIKNTYIYNYNSRELFVRKFTGREDVKSH